VDECIVRVKRVEVDIESVGVDLFVDVLQNLLFELGLNLHSFHDLQGSDRQFLFDEILNVP